MKKYSGTRYASVMDASAWGTLGTVIVACICPMLFDPAWWTILLMSAMILFVLITYLGIYYRIDGNDLVVYQFFIPKAYPIDKIAEIKPTKTKLSAPATSLTRRLAIRFSDPTVLKSYLPLIISPVRQQDFIAQLRSLNPAIKNNH